MIHSRRSYRKPYHEGKPTNYTLLFVMFLLLGIFVGLQFSPEKEVIKEVPVPAYSEQNPKILLSLPAVDGKGNGVLTDMSVQAILGEGRILTDIEVILFLLDTQQSIQTANKAAENYLNKKMDNVDLTYTIKVNGTNVVGGPSAGAAFAAATIATLENKSLRDDVIITGTVEDNGSIGQVGSIIAKGKAAKEGGYARFLVPEGEKNLLEYRREKECESFGSERICDIKYNAVEVDVEREIGIEVIEVSDITEALNYLL